MISYQVERYTDIQEEVNEMVFVHAKETDIYQEHFSLDPDFNQYLAMDSVGLIRLFTARDKGVLIGYLMFFVMPHPHYKTIVYANNDILFVSKPYRGEGKVLSEMFSLAEASLKEEGVSVVCFCMKSHLQFKSSAEKMGYQEAEIMYSKYIKEEG